MQELQNFFKRNAIMCHLEKSTNFSTLSKFSIITRQYITLSWHYYKYLTCIGINISLNPNTSMN